ncbi:adenylyltransferase/cytidyltransferase family protein [Candidatus Sumerlaeota bacterium]|nr:adenylyltransferase/cytidyltransferase family protein [Candidatus Sumerlaeota bacterium]
MEPLASAREKILTLDQAKSFAARCRAEGKILVMANGCFDLLHGGHISYLEAARAEGDTLLVGINSDASERAIKGAGRPIIPQDERAELIAGMGAVDAVVIFDEPNCERLLREIRPDVHAKGTDYTKENVPERAVALELGIRIAITGDAKENNSKDIIRTVREAEITP